MPRGIRKQEGEELSNSNIDRVITALEAENPITKTEACKMLNISYNTTRLNKIIESHKEKMAFRADMRKKMRGQPIDKATASEISSSYLSGDSLSAISDKTYRSINVVKNVLKKYNIPIRNSAVTYNNPIELDPNSWAEDYKQGDLVYSARYDEPATIKGEHKQSTKVYKLWLHKSARFALQPYYELADLRKLQIELDIKMQDMDPIEIKTLIAEGLRNAKKQEDKRK